MDPSNNNGNQQPSIEDNNVQNQNNDSEEDENEYYDHLPADHPHLRRFQLSLEDQLKSEEEKIRLLYKTQRNLSEKEKK